LLTWPGQYAGFLGAPGHAEFLDPLKRFHRLRSGNVLEPLGTGTAT